MRCTEGALGGLDAAASAGVVSGGGSGARLGLEPAGNDADDEIGIGGIGTRLGPLLEGGGAGMGGSEERVAPLGGTGGAERSGGGAERGGTGAGGKLWGFDPAGTDGGRGAPVGGAGKPNIVSRFGRSLLFAGMMLGRKLGAVVTGARFLMLAIGVFV
jgi:hypothetical protein